MQADLRLKVPDGTRSGYNRAGGNAVELERIARLESLAVTLRYLGLKQTILSPPPLKANTPPQPLQI